MSYHKFNTQIVRRMQFINLKQFRQDKNLSQKELVDLSGLPQSTVSYIENGYQDVRGNQLAALKQAFPDVDFSQYIHESDSYPNIPKPKLLDEEANRKFRGDWSRPNPVDRIEGMDVLMKMGRASISFEGDIILDRNDGTFLNLGYYVLEPDLFDDADLIDHLTEKGWFNDELYEDFKRCYLIACRLVGKQPVKQIKLDY